MNCRKLVWFLVDNLEWYGQWFGPTNAALYYCTSQAHAKHDCDCKLQCILDHINIFTIITRLCAIWCSWEYHYCSRYWTSAVLHRILHVPSSICQVTGRHRDANSHVLTHAQDQSRHLVLFRDDVQDHLLQTCFRKNFHKTCTPG